MKYIQAENYEVMTRIFKHYDIIQNNFGVEVGVRHGYFSNYLLLAFSELHLICVDPYLPYNDCGYVFSEEKQDSIYEKTIQLLESFVGRAVLFRTSSLVGATFCIDSKADFVFIDAEHTYERVCEDLEAWIIKVRPGGLMCGHDFSMGGVKEAVLEKVAKYGKKLFFSPPNEADVWWFQI